MHQHNEKIFWGGEGGGLSFKMFTLLEILKGTPEIVLCYSMADFYMNYYNLGGRFYFLN